ncbi:hypothetical protein L1049_017558 [Liquidambar formosana]|uniref:ENTH domain-containing protein n=1 Tax=Liquidambar formosana TaxID=63359 RepID=A0AAP0X4D8_LIQFO
MGTLLIDQLKRQASSFLHDKYRNARLALTDVTQAELLTEEATNNDPWGPDARTMTRIAEASYDMDDYWRIVDVLHRRLYRIDWRQWRLSYKALVLLEFLLTHGPEEFADDFQCNIYVIQELGTFKHVDEKGFNWGANMQKKSERILRLLGGGETLKEARLKAIKVTKEIKGFGSPMSSPSSSSSKISRTSSFGSYSTTSSPSNAVDELNKSSPTKASIENYSRREIQDQKVSNSIETDFEGLRLWDCTSIQESGSLLDPEDKENEREDGFAGGSPSKCHGEKSTFRSFSDVGRVMKKKFERQFSIGY